VSQDQLTERKNAG